MNKLGNMKIDGGLLVSSQSPKGIFRPYGMRKWLDDYKLNKGLWALYVINNDIYLDIQSDFYGKDDELVGTPYLKFYQWRYARLLLKSSFRQFYF